MKRKGNKNKSPNPTMTRPTEETLRVADTFFKAQAAALVMPETFERWQKEQLEKEEREFYEKFVRGDK